MARSEFAALLRCCRVALRRFVNCPFAVPVPLQSLSPRRVILFSCQVISPMVSLYPPLPLFTLSALLPKVRNQDVV